MYKQDYSKYLNNKPVNKKGMGKKIWGWTKIFLFIFVIFSMLWGCVQMFVSDYQLGTITDMTGNTVYSPGVSFEIILGFLGDSAHKTHHITVAGDGLQEAQYKSISTWGQAFSNTGGSFYYGFFVYPMAFILVGFIRLFAGANSEGIMDFSTTAYGVGALMAIFLTSIGVRGFTLIFTWKTQKNQEKMTSLQGKQAEIQNKYKGSADPQSKQKQQAELMNLYKKEGISPMSSFASMFITMPFLFAMYSVIRSTHALKVAKVGEISLIEVPWQQTTHGHFVYFTLIALYLPLQVLSMFLPTILQISKNRKKTMSEQQKKSRKKQIIMQCVFIFMFIFFVSSVASGVAIYWIFSSTFQVCQTLGFHYAKETKPARLKKKREKLKQKTIKKIESIKTKNNADNK